MVVVRPLQPGNVGAIARAMSNFGCDQLVLVDPPAYDPDQARWMAPGAHEIVDRARIVGSMADALVGATTVLATTTRQRRWPRPTLDPEEAARHLLDAGEGGALLFGPEDKGLSTDDLSLADALVTIPTAGLESLNVSAAAVVLLRALLVEAQARGLAPTVEGRQRSRGGGKTKAKRAPASQLRADAPTRGAICDEAIRALGRTDYLHSRSDEQVRTSLYDILSRAALTEKEASMLRGMLKRALKA